MCSEFDYNILHLPPELREKVLGHFLNVKFRQKREQGWDAVHAQIHRTPFCPDLDMISSVSICDCSYPTFRGVCVRGLVRDNRRHFILEHLPYLPGDSEFQTDLFSC